MKSLSIQKLLFAMLLFAVGCSSQQSRTNLETAGTDSVQSKTEPIKLTTGPKQHWFGYYDKQQMDPSGRYVLGVEVDTIYRSPDNADTVVIGMVDMQDNNKWIALGKSNAWGWQQGCMLQWIPGSSEEIIWNDIENGRFVSRIYNIKTKKTRTLPKAIYTLSNDGTFALGTEFNRIQNLRPGYGYPGVEDPYAKNKFPSEIGIYKMDLKTGNSTMIISISEMAVQPNNGEDLTNYWHWFNHLLIAPDDKRFVFLHRWRKEMGSREQRAVTGFTTRMISANVDGSEKYVLDPSGFTSHFVWQDPQHLCMWTKPEGKDWGFYLFKDKTREVEPVGAGIMTQNGHNTYVNKTNFEWILNDTYPSKEDRLQTLYLYHVPTRDTITLGKFYEPEKFRSEWRADLHPKSSPDGKWVIFDSTHGGDGRQLYAVPIGHIVNLK